MLVGDYNTFYVDDMVFDNTDFTLSMNFQMQRAG